LNPQPKFLVHIDDNGLFATELFLIQHNACGVGCATGALCAKCADCGKNAGGCVQCGGLASQDCISDARLKENLVLIGQSEKGINIYEFNYIGRKEKYQGVIAQELLNTDFESALIISEDGYYSVNYEKLDVEFKQID
jgi:predicted  nucleic acid-binding Zn-ribbon protein